VTVTFVYQGERRHCSLDLSGIVDSLFEVTPPYVFFGQTSAEKPRSREVRVRRTDGKPLTLEAIADTSISDLDIRTCPEGPEAAVSIVTLTLKATANGRSLYGAIVLRTNQDKQSTINIPFAAVAKR
jgi:hypothetical protein